MVEKSQKLYNEKFNWYFEFSNELEPRKILPQMVNIQGNAHGLFCLRGLAYYDF